MEDDPGLDGPTTASAGDRDLWLVREPPGGLRPLKRLKDLLGLGLGLSELKAGLGRLPLLLAEGVHRQQVEARLAGETELAAAVDYAPRGGRPGEGPDSLPRLLEDMAVGRGDLPARLRALAEQDPEAIPQVLYRALDQAELARPFLDAFLDEASTSGHGPRLVEHALEAAEDPRSDLPEALLEVCARRRVELLHPHLERLFELELEGLEETYFRGAGEAARGLFQRVMAEDPRDPRRCQRAWHGLLESRDPACWQAAWRQVDAFGGRDPRVHFHEVGMEVVDDVLRNLVPPGRYHLEFPAGILAADLEPVVGLDLAEAGPVLRFGGAGSGACAACSGSRHHLLTLDPIPEGCGVSGRSRLVLEACLACLGWEEPALFYRHGPAGAPEESVPPGLEPRAPRFPTEGLVEAQVTLVPTPPARRWQDWGAAARDENLHRLGGAPTWIQGAQYPECPGCARTMGFLLQLDSRLPEASGHEWMWGSGGIAYGFWCDPCGVSGFLWQCT